MKGRVVGAGFAIETAVVPCRPPRSGSGSTKCWHRLEPGEGNVGVHEIRVRHGFAHRERVASWGWKARGFPSHPGTTGEGKAGRVNGK